MRNAYRLCLVALACVLPSIASAESSTSVTFHNSYIYDSYGDPRGTGNLNRTDLKHVGDFYVFIRHDGELVKFAHIIDRQVVSVTTVKHKGLTTTISTKSADGLPIELVTQHRQALGERPESCPATAIESQETTTYFYGDSDEASSTITNRMETDPCGRILASEATLQDGESAGRLEFGYEEVGGVTVMTSVRPVSSNASASFAFYDLEGRLVRSLNYDVDGSLMSEDRQYYDEYGRITRHVGLDVDGEMLYESTYEYDDRGRLINTMELTPMEETAPTDMQDATEAVPMEEADRAE